MELDCALVGLTANRGDTLNEVAGAVDGEIKSVVFGGEILKQSFHRYIITSLDGKVWYNWGYMRKNPKPSVAGKGVVTREAGAKPKPHEYVTAEALADAGYNVRFIQSSVNMSMADCYVNDTLFEMKAPEGRTIKCVERNLRKAVNHQAPNIVIDSFRVRDIQDRSIQSFLITCLRRGRGLQRVLFVNRKREVVDINQLLR